MIDAERRRPLLVVEHAATCPPARLGTALTEAGMRLDVRRPYAGDPLPDDLTAYAGLVVLGGEMGARDAARFGWLTPTMALLRLAVEEQVPTLAVCLGHQLLAVAAGGVVERCPTGPQLGLRTVGMTDAGRADVLLGPVPDGAVAVHWNGDLVVALPPGAVELARSEAGVQAYRLGTSVWGVQFHPEVDEAVVRGWADADAARGALPAPTADALVGDLRAAEPTLARTWADLAGRFATLTR